MVDYTFYTDSYLGTKVPEKLFPAYAQRAWEELERLKRCYRVTSSGEISEKLALCAMAEALYDHRKSENIQSASVGNVSVRYQDGSKAEKLHTQLYRCAEIYLTICRGVGSRVCVSAGL